MSCRQPVSPHHDTIWLGDECRCNTSSSFYVLNVMYTNGELHLPSARRYCSRAGTRQGRGGVRKCSLRNPLPPIGWVVVSVTFSCAVIGCCAQRTRTRLVENVTLACGLRSWWFRWLCEYRERLKGLGPHTVEKWREWLTRTAVERKHRAQSRRDRVGVRLDGVHNTPVHENWPIYTHQVSRSALMGSILPGSSEPMSGVI